MAMDEIRDLSSGLLHVDSKPLGQTSLTEWLRANRETVGKKYANELAARVNR